jgi:hypothetical protein
VQVAAGTAACHSDRAVTDLREAGEMAEGHPSVAVGTVPAGRMVPITALNPLKPWGRTWLRLLFFLAGHFDFVFMRSIRRLAFIHFARWTILPRDLPPNAPRRERQRLRQHYLLFETNFNGDWAEYLDTFALAIPNRLRAVWSSTFGWPGPRPTEPFKANIRANDFGADYYYCAYPEASMSMILAAVELDRALPELIASVERLDAQAFKIAFDAFLARRERLL